MGAVHADRYGFRCVVVCYATQPGTTRPFKWLQLNPLGLSYFRLGEAFEAEGDSVDSSWVEATKVTPRPLAW